MKTITWATLLFVATSAHSTSYLNNFEVSAAGGADWYSVVNTDAEISWYETDSLFINEIATSGAWKIGLGYWAVPNLLAEMNLYQTFTTLSGDVWQYQLPQFNNYSFEAPITSTRLMWELKPNVGTYAKITPYLILGIGVSWNTVSYSEKVTGADVAADTRLSLSDNTTAALAWDLGVGVSYTIINQLSISAEYIYAFLGDGSPSTSAEFVTLTQAPTFSLQTQSLLIGLSYQF